LICKALGKTPDELAEKFDDVTWAWAFSNVLRDQEEKGKLLFSLMDTLTWWLQPDIKQKMNRQRTQSWPKAKNFLNELREQGASEEYIKKELARMQEEQVSSEAGFYQGDDLEVIK